MATQRWQLRPARPGDRYDIWYLHWMAIGYHPAVAAILAHYDATDWQQGGRR